MAMRAHANLCLTCGMPRASRRSECFACTAVRSGTMTQEHWAHWQIDQLFITEDMAMAIANSQLAGRLGRLPLVH